MDPNSERTITIVQVTGMTCDHCVASVKNEIGRLAGVSEVGVVLVPGGESSVAVTSAGTLDMDHLAAAIDEAGYDLAPASR